MNPTEDGLDGDYRNLPQTTHALKDSATIRPHGYCSAWLNLSYSDLLGDPELEVAGSAASRRSRV